ncbi:MAG: ABC transporter permease, partial [Bryobacteraceae bacterium]
MMDGIEQRKEECRDVRRVHWLEDLGQDARYAVRTLIKTPGFTVVAAMVLTLGIGANTAVFTIVNGVLLRPLPFSEPDRLFLISSKLENNPFVPAGPLMSDRDYLECRRQDKFFDSIATFGRESLTLTGAGDPAVVNASPVTPDFLRVLRVHPAIGRTFLPEGQEDSDVVLISDRLWHSRWNGDPTILGKTITLDGVSYAVAGVMPPSFTFQDADVWRRMEVASTPAVHTSGR